MVDSILKHIFNGQVNYLTARQNTIKVNNNIYIQGQLAVLLRYLPMKSNITMYLNNIPTAHRNLVVSHDLADASQRLITYLHSPSTDTLALAGYSYTRW